MIGQILRLSVRKPLRCGNGGAHALSAVLGVSVLIAWMETSALAEVEMLGIAVADPVRPYKRTIVEGETVRTSGKAPEGLILHRDDAQPATGEWQVMELQNKSGIGWFGWKERPQKAIANFGSNGDVVWGVRAKDILTMTFEYISVRGGAAKIVVSRQEGEVQWRCSASEGAKIVSSQEAGFSALAFPACDEWRKAWLTLDQIQKGGAIQIGFGWDPSETTNSFLVRELKLVKDYER